jgi:subtilisin family serine protease
MRDLNGHGTVVAGIIAANVNNGIGIAGVNPWAKIMPLKVADHKGRTDTIKVAKAIVYAADSGARVINVSLGAKINAEVVKRAIDYAAKKNALVVVSAGNSGVDVKDFTPSAFANTIAVAAVDTASNRAGFSNFGDNITIAAPGVDILSLRAGGTDLMMHVKKDYQRGSAVVNQRYYRVDGTSFAAPMVAGVASLIFSMRPELSAAQVKRMILQSARDIGDPGRDRNLGYGMLDADAALKADPAFFVEAAIAGLSVVAGPQGQAVRVTGTAAADRMRAAWVEVGEGENPSQWRKVSTDVTRAVEGGVIGDIPASNFAGSKVWTLRVVTQHQNGRTREGRFILRLG